MAINIFDISTWTSGENWTQHDPVLYNGVYYYALKNVTNSTTAPSSDTTNFGGRKIDQDGVGRPIFLWICSYNFNVNREPSVKQVKMGDGYEQRMANGINNTLLDLDVTFDNRSSREARGIEHFLTVQAGVTAFLYTSPGVFSKEKLFVCSQWSNSNKFYNNYSIKAKFKEVPA